MASGGCLSRTSLQNDIYSPCGTCEAEASFRCARCHQVRYCSKECQKSHWKNHKAACADIKAMELVVEVRPSMIHGQGVFATRYIPKGSRVCFFDYDIKRWHMHAKLSINSSSQELSICNAESFFKSYAKENPDYDRSMYLYPSFERYDEPCTGYVLVARNWDKDKTSPFAVGHFINDSAIPSYRGEEVSISEATVATELYMKSSLTRQNVEIDDNFWFVTTRDVLAGEELFTTYGREYWLHRHILNCKTPSTRFMLYTLLTFMDDHCPYHLFRAAQFDEKTSRAFLTCFCGYSETDLAVAQSYKLFIIETVMGLEKAFKSRHPPWAPQF